MNLKRLRKAKLAIVAAVLIGISTRAVFAQTDSYFVEQEVIINVGAIGAVIGVFVRVFVKWKEKEFQLRREKKLRKGESLHFNWRYGYVALFTMAIELIPTVVLPAIALGSVFASGDPCIDFTNGLCRGAVAASLITAAMKHIKPMNLPEEGG